VDLDQHKLLAHGLSAQDVAHALAQQNIVLPAGDQKIGALDFLVETNASPVNVATFDSLPIKQVGGTVVTVGDVAHVHLGGPPQTNAVLVRGRQSVLIEVLKAGDASTLAVVAGVKAKLPQLEQTLPAGVKITTLNDASIFVSHSVADVLREMVMAALLTGLVVLLFLGSGRSTLIVATSIPRTAVTELTVDNSKHTLWPGTYVDVVFQVPTDPTMLTMPEQALIFRAAGTQVAIVDGENRCVVTAGRLVDAVG
jgi:multidrug efflux pump subunit AcrB